MTELILIEIVAVPAERSRHNPRVVKRKMSNFPTKSRSATPVQRFRYDEHIVIVAPPERSPPRRLIANERLLRPASRRKPITKPSGRPRFKRGAVCRAPSTANSTTCHREPSTRPSLACARPSVLPPIQLKSTVLALARIIHQRSG